MITFKSDAAADLMMFDDVAEQLLAIIGKTWDKPGIITVEQLPDAIGRLKRAIADNKAQKPPADIDDERKIERAPTSGERKFVSLAQRAIPLIQVMERSLERKKPVVWGV
jgi:hypothetical protein